MQKRIVLAAAAAALGVMFLGYSASPTSATVTCDRYAATTGSDSAAGSASAPFKTAQKLIDSLTAGKTGCLGAGTYNESLRFNHGGSPGSPIRLTSAPGGRATVVGRMFIPDGSDDVAVAELNLDGRNASNLPSPSVSGDRVTFSNNDVTNGHTGICFTVGSALGWGIAHDTVIDANRIHDCGRLPSTNHDHGIYVESSRNAVITNNYIYGNADRGVQLYPDAQGTTVANNVIDGNGEGVSFGGESAGGEYHNAYASSGNVVSRNIISNSRERFNVEAWWGGPIGVSNVAKDNCLWNGAQGNVDLLAGGFLALANVVAKPDFVDAAAGDFRLRAGSPCAGMGPG